MHDHVVGALHEGGVDGEKRLEALRCETGGKKRGMFLRNAHIEVAGGMSCRKMSQAGAAGHGAGNGADLRVLLGKLRELFAEEFGKGGSGRRFYRAGCRLKFSQTMEFVRLFQGGRETAAFLRKNMEDYRLVLRLEEFEGADE